MTKEELYEAMGRAINREIVGGSVDRSEINKILAGQKQKWVTMVMVEGISRRKWYTDEAIQAVKTLWASCQVPDSHLEDPDDILPKLLRYTQAIDAGLKEKNWNAFVFGNRFEEHADLLHTEGELK